MLPFLTMTNHPLDDAAQFERVPPFKSFPSPKQIAALNQVLDELKRACESFPPFASAHEGFAILKEEVDELWDEVKKNPKTRDPQKLLVEAKQVATMAMRFMLDVCGDQINLPSGGRMGQDRRAVLRFDRRGRQRRRGNRRKGDYFGCDNGPYKLCDRRSNQNRRKS